MAIPNPNPNIADGIKSDNKTYSSNKIESLIKTATELPIPESGDAGKVLSVNSDEDGYELTTPLNDSDVNAAINAALDDRYIVRTQVVVSGTGLAPNSEANSSTPVAVTDVEGYTPLCIVGQKPGGAYGSRAIYYSQLTSSGINYWIYNADPNRTIEYSLEVTILYVKN